MQRVNALKASVVSSFVVQINGFPQLSVCSVLIDRMLLHVLIVTLSLPGLVAV
jgi:hypothetical protein